jgi:hypothetical protein
MFHATPTKRPNKAAGNTGSKSIGRSESESRTGGMALSIAIRRDPLGIRA